MREEEGEKEAAALLPTPPHFEGYQRGIKTLSGPYQDLVCHRYQFQTAGCLTGPKTLSNRYHMDVRRPDTWVSILIHTYQVPKNRYPPDTPTPKRG